MLNTPKYAECPHCTQRVIAHTDAVRAATPSGFTPPCNLTVEEAMAAWSAR
jgi:hypothetical protein